MQSTVGLHVDGERFVGTLVRVDPGRAVVSTRILPPLGSPVGLRIPSARFGELYLPTVVRWHADDELGLQIGALRARDVWALNQLSRPHDLGPRLRLHRAGFDLDAVDVVALTMPDHPTLITRRPRPDRAVLWLRNARFDVNLLELTDAQASISAPVVLRPGTRVALTFRQDDGADQTRPWIVRAARPGLIELACAVPRRAAA